MDEVGYIPFDPAAANLIFQLVSARYERASLIVTSNKPFSAWGEIFGDEVVAAAMIDRLVHHAEIIALKGDSFGCATRTWRAGRLTTEGGSLFNRPSRMLRFAYGSATQATTPFGAGAFSTGASGCVFNRP